MFVTAHFGVTFFSVCSICKAIQSKFDILHNFIEFCPLLGGGGRLYMIMQVICFPSIQYHLRMDPNCDIISLRVIIIDHLFTYYPKVSCYPDQPVTNPQKQAQVSRRPNKKLRVAFHLQNLISDTFCHTMVYEKILLVVLVGGRQA